MPHPNSPLPSRCHMHVQKMHVHMHSRRCWLDAMCTCRKWTKGPGDFSRAGESTVLAALWEYPVMALGP